MTSGLHSFTACEKVETSASEDALFCRASFLTCRWSCSQADTYAARLTLIWIFTYRRIHSGSDDTVHVRFTFSPSICSDQRSAY